MARSLAGRAALGRPFGPAAPRYAGRGASASARSGRRDAHARRRWRAYSILAGAARAIQLFLRRHRRLRIALLALLISSPLLVGGWLWLRDSPLLAVEQVQISGVHGPEASAIDAALVSA